MLITGKTGDHGNRIFNYQSRTFTSKLLFTWKYFRVLF